MDKITMDRIQLLHPQLRIEATVIYSEICKLLTPPVTCRFAYTYRSFPEQDALYQLGRTKPGKKVTNARAGQSYHNYGLAIDIVLLIDKDHNGSFETASWDTHLDADADGIADWQEIVKVFKSYGWEWGGDWRFKDDPHFQKTFGLSVQTLLSRHNNKEFVTAGYVRI